MKANCTRCKKEFENDLELLLSPDDPSQATARMNKGEYTQKQIDSAMKKCIKLCPDCHERARDGRGLRYNPPEGEMIVDGFRMAEGIGEDVERISDSHPPRAKKDYSESDRTLADYDFARVGSWKLCPVAINGIDFKIPGSKLRTRSVFYAFVVNDVIKYIGVCPNNETTLELEIKTYEHAHEDNKYKVIAGKIKGCLDKEEDVRIKAAKPDAYSNKEGLDDTLVKAFMSTLIREFQPEWNSDT